MKHFYYRNRERAKEAVLTLAAIRALRFSELTNLPKDVVNLICLAVWASREDMAWV